MEPKDFFQTAELLEKKTDEAHLRTSVGRSYYAAFLYFREYLKSIGLCKRKSPHKDVHVFVIQCLGFSEVPEGSRASTYLRDLQQVREDADYHLDEELSQNDAEDALMKAKKVIEDYHIKMTPEKEKTLIKNATCFAKRKNWV